jgi:hypothetical protein
MSLSLATSAVYFYNDRRNFTAVMCNPNGKGFIVTATNIAKGETIEVSNVIESIDDADNRAKHFAGLHTFEPVNPDEVEQYLSERLGF